MPIKIGACHVCNDTKKCSVCGGNGMILNTGDIVKDKHIPCPTCMGSGQCKHCRHRKGSGGWQLQ